MTHHPTTPHGDRSPGIPFPSLPYAQTGFTSVTPFLMVNNANKTVSFLKDALEAEEIFSLQHDDGTLFHARLRIGDALVMIGDAMNAPEHNHPAVLYAYVPDADKAYRRALAAGAEPVMAPSDQFYGDRNAAIRDPGGNIWWLATKIEDLTPEELIERGKKWGKQDHIKNSETN